MSPTAARDQGTQRHKSPGEVTRANLAALAGALAGRVRIEDRVKELKASFDLLPQVPRLTRRKRAALVVDSKALKKCLGKIERRLFPPPPPAWLWWWYPAATAGPEKPRSPTPLRRRRR